MKKIIIVAALSVLVACGKETVQTPEPTTTTANQIQTTVTNPPVEENNAVVDIATPDTTINSQPRVSTQPRTTNSTTARKTVQPSVLGHINIPSIGVDWDIREGIELSVLNKGPGHYPHSPKPCRAGNAAIAGHRTTYGAPFNKLDVLKDGDLINITTPEGDCTYKYLRTEIVNPNNIDVVMPKGGNVLTLTACHPKGSAAKRIVVTATLENVIVK